MTSQQAKDIEAICQSLAWLGLDKSQKIAVRDAIERAYAAGANSAAGDRDHASEQRTVA